jgi:hypothetical protein
MTLRRAYELGLTLAATVSLFTVLLGGELPLLAWLAIAAPSVAATLQSRGIEVPGSVGTAIGSGGFAWGLLLFLQKGMDALVVAGGLTLVGVMVGRMLTRRNLVHDLQAMLISLLLVFAGTVLHTQVTYGPLFVVYAVSGVWALVARQLVVGAEKEAERPGGAPIEATLSRRDIVTPAFLAVTAGIALVLLVSSTILFVLFPRFGIGSFGFMRTQRGRLPPSVSLVGLARAGAGGGDVVARVRGLPYAAFERGLYLRGPIYGQLTGTGFTHAEHTLVLPPSLVELAPAAMHAQYEVFMQPVAGPILLTLGPIDNAVVLAGGSANPSHGVHVVRTGRKDQLMASRNLTGPIRYWVAGGLRGPGWVGEIEAPAGAGAEVPSELSDFLSLPDDLDPRIPELAARVVGRETTLAGKVEAIRNYLLENHDYDVELPNSGKPDPLAGFLFEDRRGHCEYFATAQAVMMRSAGVPTRVVGGFQGGMWDEEGGVAVFTSGNAHVWVEWYQPGVGWVPDDATPAVLAPRLHFSGLSAWIERMSRRWDEYVVEYGLNHQIAMLYSLADMARGQDAASGVMTRPRGLSRANLVRAAVILGLLALAAGLVWRWRRLRSLAQDREHPLGAAIRGTVERLSGEEVPASQTLRSAVDACLADDLCEPAAGRVALGRALELYEAERFGDQPMDPAELRRLARDLTGLKATGHRAPQA